MTRILKPLALAAIVVGLSSLAATPTLARGGGSSILTSPGYQRALEESRKAYLRATAQPVATVPYRHRVRHRHAR